MVDIECTFGLKVSESSLPSPSFDQGYIHIYYIHVCMFFIVESARCLFSLQSAMVHFFLLSQKMIQAIYTSGLSMLYNPPLPTILSCEGSLAGGKKKSTSVELRHSQACPSDAVVSYVETHGC